MSDQQQQPREAKLTAIGDDGSERARLEQQYGEVWTTDEATAAFEFRSFASPYAYVIRRSDGQRGWLAFQHNPRYYFDFSPT